MYERVGIVKSYWYNHYTVVYNFTWYYITIVWYTHYMV